jgi:hypothetical protein
MSKTETAIVPKPNFFVRQFMAIDWMMIARALLLTRPF